MKNMLLQEESDGFDERTSSLTDETTFNTQINQTTTTSKNQPQQQPQQQQNNTNADLTNQEIDEDDEEDDEISSSSSSSSSKILKCRSAPVSPTRQLISASHHRSSTSHTHRRTTLDAEAAPTKKPTTTVASSFIYDMNLYNDSNHIILNNAEEFNKGLMRLRKNKNSTVTSNIAKPSDLGANSPCNSSTSSFASIKLEPLVINEEETNNDNKTVINITFINKGEKNR